MPMKITDAPFFERVDQGLNDTYMRKAVTSAQERLRGGRLRAADELGNWDEWTKLGEEIRAHTIENLDYYLDLLSEKVAEKGGHVFFAETGEEANRYVQQVVKQKDAKKIVKSKSMVTEEISLNAALEEIGCEVIETDLGEYILQIDDNDPPSHFVGPAIHKNKEQIRDTFSEKKHYTNTEKPEELTMFVRELLREEFLTADVGITGCNFAVAESGSVTLVTNEGNARLVTAIPKTQITVMGMERIVPTWEDFDIIAGLLSRSAVGQKLSTYVTGLTGPRGEGDVDGPEEFHLVIVDNKRSDALGTVFQSALHCIRCAACLNVCPVYNHIGGHAYGSIYSGPIGAVLSPILGGYEDYKELPFASSLCAACTEACPVNIPLHELLIEHRRIIVEEKGDAPMSEKLAMKTFQVGAGSPLVYKVGTKAAARIMSPFASDERITNGPKPVKPWTTTRDFPAPQNERFRDWYKQRQKGESGDG